MVLFYTVMNWIRLLNDMGSYQHKLVPRAYFYAKILGHKLRH